MNTAPVFLALVAVVTGVVGVQVMAATSGSLDSYVNKSEAWCDQHNGDLYNAQALGDHGGLHCELSNGTSVHMSEVVSRGS